MTVQRTDWAEEFVAGFLGLPLAIDTILLRPQRRDRVGDREVCDVLFALRGAGVAVSLKSQQDLTERRGAKLEAWCAKHSRTAASQLGGAVRTLAEKPLWCLHPRRGRVEIEAGALEMLHAIAAVETWEPVALPPDLPERAPGGVPLTYLSTNDLLNVAVELRAFPDIVAYLDARLTLPLEMCRTIGHERVLCAYYLLNGENFDGCAARSSGSCGCKRSRRARSPARVGNEGPSSGLASTRAHESMNDDELLNYSREHVSYELLMLYETAARLVNDPKVHDDWVVKNALLEAFTIHARLVAAFLFPDVIQPRKDDITALHYVREPSAWAAARGPLPAELKTVITRTGKEIAHLTRLRYPSGAPEKGWTLASIVRTFFPPLRRFLEHAVPGRLDTSVTAFIAELPDDAAQTSGAGAAITFGETML